MADRAHVPKMRVQCQRRNPTQIPVHLEPPPPPRSNHRRHTAVGLVFHKNGGRSEKYRREGREHIRVLSFFFIKQYERQKKRGD